MWVSVWVRVWVRVRVRVRVSRLARAPAEQAPLYASALAVDGDALALRGATVKVVSNRPTLSLAVDCAVRTHDYTPRNQLLAPEAIAP